MGEGDAREIEDLGDGVLTYAEVKAAATGDRCILELTEVQAEISRLRGLATRTPAGNGGRSRTPMRTATRRARPPTAPRC